MPDQEYPHVIEEALVRNISIDKEPNAFGYGIDHATLYITPEHRLGKWSHVCYNAQTVALDDSITKCPLCEFDTEWRLDSEDDKQTPREEFEAHFGAIIDEDWQWLKEFTERHYIPRSTDA